MVYPKNQLIIEFLITFLEKKQRKEHTHHEFRRFLRIVRILLNHHFGMLEWHGTAERFCKAIIYLTSKGLLKHSHSRDCGKIALVLQLFVTFRRANGQRKTLSPTGLITTMYKVQSKLKRRL